MTEKSKKDFGKFGYDFNVAEIVKKPNALNAMQNGPAKNYTMAFFKDNKAIGDAVILDHALFFDEPRENRALFSVLEAYHDTDGVVIKFMKPAETENGLDLVVADEVVCHQTAEDDILAIREEYFARAQNFTRQFADALQGGPRF